MKRIITAVIIISILLSGCGAVNTESGTQELQSSAENKVETATGGVWLSFTEIRSMLTSPKGFQNEVAAVADNCNKLGLQNVYIHVRSHCDSIFKSEFFPLAEALASYDYDVFEFMINTFHSKGIKVHAWINPYRVSTASADVSAVRSDSPIHKWLSDDLADNDKNVCIYNGVYLNPAEEEVRRLVIDGVREIAINYQVDGIHFDDYFYPTTDDSFDADSYKVYKQNAAKPLELDEWRRANVNALISGCYSAIKFISKDIIFSISPAASIEKNYSELYADVESWVENGNVDCIIPQLYFGFEYADSKYRFKKLLNDWKELMSSNGEVELLIGLASYKIGTDTEADGTEWQRDTDIIARQVKMCYDDDRIGGYVLFSYSSLMSEEELNTKQRENLIKFKEGLNWTVL